MFVGHETGRFVDVHPAACGLEVSAHVVLDAVREPHVVLVGLSRCLEGVDVCLVGLRVEETNYSGLRVLFLQKLEANQMEENNRPSRVKND